MTTTLKRIGYVSLWLLLVAWLIWPPVHDDTDPPDGRSGMKLYTDHKTGCQYLSAPLSSITPRLDGEGRHVGCKP
jgi:hypothetical protein